MRHLIRYLWGFILVISSPTVSSGSISDSIFVYNMYERNINPLTGKRYFGIIKVNTLQVLFSEAPFTFEKFIKNDLSLQFQTGIIFPLESDSFLEQFFRSTGSNSTASSRGFISYRNSPYNNHGLSFKFEIRKYLDNYYYAPQVTFKYCWYDETEFPVSIENTVMHQTESKRSRIFGVGLMVGRQTYFMKQATDWYAGAGLRRRQTSATVLKIEDPGNKTEVIYPGNKDTSFMLYPFVNFGFRIGLVL